MARFDWYQGTVRAPLPVVQAALREGLGGEWELAARKAPHGYAGVGLLKAPDGGQVATLWWGGMHEHPHVVASGEGAQAAAEVLRAELPDHTVSRCDACIDYAEPGAYERLQALAVDVARARRIKVGTAGDHLVTLEGRTLYLGSPKSPTMLRLYDKAAELRAALARDPVRLAEVPDQLARLECQVRPQTPQAKRAAALADPMTVMGSAAWMRELMRHVAGLELHPFEVRRPWLPADDERTRAALLAQYGGYLRRCLEDQGSWDMVGRQLGEDLDARDRAKGRAHGVR